jgi:hypothetical protein
VSIKTNTGVPKIIFNVSRLIAMLSTRVVSSNFASTSVGAEGETVKLNGEGTTAVPLAGTEPSYTSIINGKVRT